MNKEELDVSKIFLAYLVACGDPVRTAQIAQCKVEEVFFLSKTELWDSKLQERGVIAGETGNAQEQTKELNRAACYVQAIRLRALIDKTIHHLYENEDNIQIFCQERMKNGKQVFSTKPLLDLVKAGEACQQMLYRSLGDFVAKDAAGASGLGAGLKDLHRYVTEAMSHLPAGAIPDMKTVEKLDPAAAAVGYLDVDQALDEPAK